MNHNQERDKFIKLFLIVLLITIICSTFLSLSLNPILVIFLSMILFLSSLILVCVLFIFLLIINYKVMKFFIDFFNESEDDE